MKWALIALSSVLFAVAAWSPVQETTDGRGRQFSGSLLDSIFNHVMEKYDSSDK